VLVDDVEGRKPICYPDPGVAHPNKEIVLVLPLRLLRQLCALSSHAPCVVALGSHDLPFRRWPPQPVMICLVLSASIFVLAYRRSLERNAMWWLAVGTDGLAD